MYIKDIIQYLEEIAPPALQESYDNSGWITGDMYAEATGVLTCLDSTEAVIDEAIAHNCNLVVAHHPIIFRGLKQITGRNYVERTIIKAIRNNIAIYAIHTNLDNVLANGVNQKIAERIGLEGLQILSPKKDVPDNMAQPVGSGILGTLPVAMPENDFLVHLKQCMQASCVRHTQLLNKTIQKVAVCGGSGSFLLPAAIAKGADIYITADYKYHDFFDADGHLVIADIGHYESEQFTIELLCDLISQKFRTFAPRKTEVNTNPVFYY